MGFIQRSKSVDIMCHQALGRNKENLRKDRLKVFLFMLKEGR